MKAGSPRKQHRLLLKISVEMNHSPHPEELQPTFVDMGLLLKEKQAKLAPVRHTDCFIPS
jgi:hypothetical protein